MKTKRLNNIFRKDGRTLIVAMDHGSGMNVLPELANPAEKIERVVAGGADVIMTTFGIASKFSDSIGSAGLILRVDGGYSQMAKNSKPIRLIYSVEDALRLGADGVVCMGFPGSQFEAETLPYLSKLASDCYKWGMPLMAEMLPRGFEGGEDSRTPENIALACRMGVELGADFIKTDFTGDAESFKQVVEGTFAPIVILGGGKAKSPIDLLQQVYDSVQAGGAGVAMGRNVWRQPEPEKITRAICRILHENATVEEAAKEL